MVSKGTLTFFSCYIHLNKQNKPNFRNNEIECALRPIKIDLNVLYDHEKLVVIKSDMY